jgi:hypothetical protein
MRFASLHFASLHFASLVLLLYLSVPARAQDDEAGARYWYSEGKTTRSHNAQNQVPSLGNPTSVLTYEDLKTHALELYGRKNLAHGGFLKGNAGLGDTRSGSFDDEDFSRGQVKFSDTTSTVKGNRLSYFTIDVGKDIVRSQNGAAGLFLGFSYWSERLDAYGLVSTVPPGPPNPPVRLLADSVPVISNEVTWQSLRVGLTSAAYLGPKTRIVFDGALIPYAKVRDEDSHWLRQSPNDLGPAPNIHIKGEGYGFQLDLELHHAIVNAWEVGAGLRYWKLRATDGTRSAVGVSVPLSELESQRAGLTLSVTHRW